jgi:hypothetical protein
MGALSADFLGGETMSTSFVHYRFLNYVALFTATHIPGGHEIVLHEPYSSAL